jgi:hypothetical protein
MLSYNRSSRTSNPSRVDRAKGVYSPSSTQHVVIPAAASTARAYRAGISSGVWKMRLLVQDGRQPRMDVCSWARAAREPHLCQRRGQPYASLCRALNAPSSSRRAASALSPCVRLRASSFSVRYASYSTSRVRVRSRCPDHHVSAPSPRRTTKPQKQSAPPCTS